MAGEVLVIFQGHESYISPSGYATKAEHGKVVPTWNYTAVHAWGDLRVIDDPHWLLAQMLSVDRNPRGGAAAALGGHRCTGRLHRKDARRHRRHRDHHQPPGRQVEGQPEPAAANQASLIAALEAGDPMAELIRQQQQ